MKAVVYSAPLTLEYLDVDEPRAQEGEVLVKVSAVGICGSELEGFASQSPFRKPPLVMGHEFSGIRMDTNTPVVVNPLIGCWKCDLCQRGMPNLCRNRQILGIHLDGAFAEYVSVPVANCHDLAPDVSPVSAAMIEPLANAIHALRLALTQIPDAARIGVVGAGMLGLAVAVVAKARGMGHIAVTDLSAERLKLADAAGADAVGAALEGEFDVIFDAVGTGDTRRISVESVRPGGVAVFVGLHSDVPGFDGRDIVRNEKHILGTFCYTDPDFAAAANLVDRVRPEWFGVRPLSEGVEAFTELLTTVPSTVKTVLLP